MCVGVYSLEPLAVRITMIKKWAIILPMINCYSKIMEWPAGNFSHKRLLSNLFQCCRPFAEPPKECFFKLVTCRFSARSTTCHHSAPSCFYQILIDECFPTCQCTFKLFRWGNTWVRCTSTEEGHSRRAKGESENRSESEDLSEGKAKNNTKSKG